MAKHLQTFSLLAVGAVASLALTSHPLDRGMPLIRSANASASVQRLGSYAKVTRRTFRTSPRNDYFYAPSEEAIALATEHRIGNRSWFEYLPDGEEPAPLIILFHGSGRTGLSMIDMWKDLAKEKGLILLAPNTLGRSWATSDFTLASLDEMLAEIEKQRRIDRNRIFLFGHSNGGGFATLLINKFDGPWAAGATHAGFASADKIETPAEAKPFRIYLGDKDHIFAEERAETTARAMARVGHSVTLQIIENHTHWYYEIGPDLAKDAWAWFESLER